MQLPYKTVIPLTSNLAYAAKQISNPIDPRREKEQSSILLTVTCCHMSLLCDITILYMPVKSARESHMQYAIRYADAGCIFQHYVN